MVYGSKEFRKKKGETKASVPDWLTLRDERACVDVGLLGPRRRASRRGPAGRPTTEAPTGESTGKAAAAAEDSSSRHRQTTAPLGPCIILLPLLCVLTDVTMSGPKCRWPGGVCGLALHVAQQCCGPANHWLAVLLVG